MGARPSTLNACGGDLVEWLKVADSADADSAAVTPPLARVRVLTVTIGHVTPRTGFSARLLRAAPHLRRLTFCVFGWVLARCVLLRELTTGSARHPRLRHVAINGQYLRMDDVPPPDECGLRLRQHQFPRLRRLTVEDEEFPVWVPLRTGRRKTF
jgi:hypothetical protein